MNIRSVLLVLSFFLLSRFESVAQNFNDEALFDKVENLLAKKQDNYAKVLLKNAITSSNDSISEQYYRYHFAKGLLLYIQKDYANSASEFYYVFTELDNNQCWNCERFLRVAYYLSDSYLKMEKKQECEQIINNALIKCAEIYDQCIYTKRMYQLLLFLYDDLGDLSPTIEQIHNEIQKISIKTNKDISSEDINGFELFYNNKKNKIELDSNDSLIADIGKGLILYNCGEYNEAIRLYERFVQKLSSDNSDIKDYYSSLFIMYCCTGRTKSIETFLPKYYKYCKSNGYECDQYSDYTIAGYYLAKNGYYKDALLYYNRCDSILNQNRKILDWEEKKKHTLDGLIYIFRNIGDNTLFLNYCKEYANYLDPTNYEEYIIINYSLSYALVLEKEYKNAIVILDKLETYIKNNKQEKTENYVRVNFLLGFCHASLNHNDKSIIFSNKALDLYEEISLNDSTLLGYLYNSIGKAYLQKEKFEQALYYLEQSATLQISTFGEVSEKTKSYIDKCKNHK